MKQYDEVIKNTHEERQHLVEVMVSGLNLDGMFAMLKGEYANDIHNLEDSIRELLQAALEERLEDDSEFIQEYDEYIPPGCEGDRDIRRLYVCS